MVHAQGKNINVTSYLCMIHFFFALLYANSLPIFANFLKVIFTWVNNPKLC